VRADDGATDPWWVGVGRRRVEERTRPMTHMLPTDRDDRPPVGRR
jgi:hypothetical protein